MVLRFSAQFEHSVCRKLVGTGLACSLQPMACTNHKLPASGIWNVQTELKTTVLSCGVASSILSFTRSAPLFMEPVTTYNVFVFYQYMCMHDC